MFYTSHAHNRFVNTLVEGGLLGLLGLLILVVGVGGLLRRNVKYISSRTDTNNAVFWVIGANSLIVVTVIGLFNTTLHHEHGILAMILIAVSCRSFTKSNHSAKKL